MQGESEKTYVRKSFSQKNGCQVTYKAENQKVFEFLEGSNHVSSYECNVALKDVSKLLEGFSFDSKMVHESYTSDFLVRYVNGDEKVLDVLQQKASGSKKMMELLDIARCYWQLKGKSWGIVTVGL